MNDDGGMISDEKAIETAETAGVPGTNEEAVHPIPVFPRTRSGRIYDSRFRLHSVD